MYMYMHMFMIMFTLQTSAMRTYEAAACVARVNWYNQGEPLV